MKYISLQQEQPELPEKDIAKYYYHKGVYEGLSQGRADALKILDEFAKSKADPVIVIKQEKQPKMNIPSAGSGAMGTTPPKFKLEVKEQPVEGLDVTDFCKPIDPGIAQCVADHWWKMIGEESTNKKPVDLEKEIEDYCGAYKDRPVPDFIEAVAHHFYELGLNARKE